jgi:hypothetical protein
VGRSQQSIDDLFERPWRRVLDKSLHLFRRGRQAGEIQRHAANQIDPACFQSVWDLLRLELLKHERINRIANPLPLLDSGNGGPVYGLKGPIAALLRSELLSRCQRHSRAEIDRDNFHC